MPPLSIAAQQSKMDMGVDAGVGLSSLRGNPIIKEYLDPRFCYSAGLFVNYNINKVVALKSGVYSDLKGSSSKVTITDMYGNSSDWTFNQNFHYLTIPLLAKLSFGEKVRFFANTGPFLSYLLKSEFQRTEYMNPGSDRETTQYSKRIDAGLVFGLGVSRSFKERFTLSLEARDNLGLADINKSGSNKAKTNTLNFLLGFGWRML